jgi:hypothetical protein
MTVKKILKKAKKKTAKKKTVPKKPPKPVKVDFLKRKSTAQRMIEAEKTRPPIKTTPMPTAGKKVIEFEKQLDAVIAADPKPTHGGTRPGAGRKPTPPKPEIHKVSPEEMNKAIIQLIKSPFDIWAARVRVEDLKLTDEEAEAIASPTIVLLDYYLPNIGEISWAWISFGIVTIGALRPRLDLLRGIRQQQPAAAGKPEPAGGRQPVGKPAAGFPNAADLKPEKL